ncbi:MAG: hypothetical protein K9M49_02140 [Candidatus Marinimicrobia bacterium]|nr:hypothetical protein [Candidatus Neomarinimicrobiota bacterium]MCF7903931.1 hypothetical protein [Candidatus Neomarinimicrobiota bacterium]
MQKFKIKIQDDSDTEPREIAIMLDSKNISILNNYLEYSEHLFASEFLKVANDTSLKFGWNKDEGYTTTYTLPPNEMIEAFLHRLRPFVLKKEDTHFMKVYGIISKNINDQSIRAILKDTRQYWEGEKIQQLFKISDNDGILNSHDSLMKFLNAYEYHRDKEKAKRFASIQEMFGGKDGLKSFYLFMLTDIAQAIGKLAGIVEVILKKRDKY